MAAPCPAVAPRRCALRLYAYPCLPCGRSAARPSLQSVGRARPSTRASQCVRSVSKFSRRVSTEPRLPKTGIAASSNVIAACMASARPLASRPRARKRQAHRLSPPSQEVKASLVKILVFGFFLLVASSPLRKHTPTNMHTRRAAMEDSAATSSVADGGSSATSDSATQRHSDRDLPCGKPATHDFLVRLHSHRTKPPQLLLASERRSRLPTARPTDTL